MLKMNKKRAGTLRSGSAHHPRPLSDDFCLSV